MPNLASLFDDIAANVPFYRGGTFARLSDLPLVTKGMIKAEYEAFLGVPDEGRRRRMVEALSGATPLPAFETALDGEVIMERTSGSSGVPFRTIKTRRERSAIGLTLWAQRREIDRLASPGNMFRMNHTSEREFDYFDFSIANVRRIYETIAARNARWIHGPPRILVEHVGALRRSGVQLSLPELTAIECNGHWLGQAARDEIAYYFGVPVLDQYGLIETWALALTCTHGRMHLNERSIALEVIDDDDQPVADGTVGRVVVTSRILRMLPFVRYVTGDYAAVSATRCDCGMSGRTLVLQQGRDINLIKGGANRRYGNLLFERVLTMLYKTAGDCGVRYAQVRQVGLKDYHLVTNQLANPRFAEAFQRVASEALGESDIVCTHVVLSDIELEQRKLEKPDIFICCF